MGFYNFCFFVVVVEFIFGCVGSSLRYVGFSCCGAWALGVQASVVVARGLSSCGSRALECRLSSCGARA